MQTYRLKLIIHLYKDKTYKCGRIYEMNCILLSSGSDKRLWPLSKEKIRASLVNALSPNNRLGKVNAMF